MAVASAPIHADQARALLKALGDPVRLRVIEALGGGERCVCDLVTDLGLAQSKLSFHLKVLKQAGLLADRQEVVRVDDDADAGVGGALSGTELVGSEVGHGVLGSVLESDSRWMGFGALLGFEQPPAELDQRHAGDRT